MKLEKVDTLVEMANNLITALRDETDYDSEDALWKFEKEHIQWLQIEELERLKSLSSEFSKLCQEVIDEISKRETF